MATISWCRWSTQRPSTETTKRAVKCRPSVGAVGKSVLSRAVCRPRGTVFVADQGKRRGGVPVTVQRVCSVLTNMTAGYPGSAHVDLGSQSCKQQVRAASEHRIEHGHMDMDMDMDVGVDVDVNMGWDGTPGNGECRHAGTVSAEVLSVALLGH